jgi:hypothetical protein
LIRSRTAQLPRRRRYPRAVTCGEGTRPARPLGCCSCCRRLGCCSCWRVLRLSWHSRALGGGRNPLALPGNHRPSCRGLSKIEQRERRSRRYFGSMYDSVSCGACGTPQVSYEEAAQHIVGCTSCNSFRLSHSQEPAFSLSPSKLAGLVAIAPDETPSGLNKTPFGRRVGEFLSRWKRPR